MNTNIELLCGTRFNFLRIASMHVCGVIVAVWAVAASAQVSNGRFVAHNTPSYAVSAKNLGPEDPSKVIDVSIWLNLHNRSKLDALANDLYDPHSPNYRHFLTRQQFATQFAPTADEAEAVRQFFREHNLKIVKTGPDNFYVRARGTVADVENAFHLQLNQYQVSSKVIRANDRDPYIEGSAATLVSSVSGLDDAQYEHPAMSRPNLSATNRAVGSAMAATVATASSFFSNDCFNGTITKTYSTDNNGSLPKATYKGNRLNLEDVTSAGCGYTPPMIRKAYNLSALYAEGFNGKGQTIGIIDWCGSLTIAQDANAFSAKFGLPKLTSSNFAITYIPTPSTCEAVDQVEINIDVEWAHAIAPGANINLIVPPSGQLQDVDEAEFTAVNYGLANVISGSYGSIERFTPSSILATENMISEMAAAMGISTNFSSGDAGDFSADGIPAAVSAPADSPWATAVGGITLALNADNSIKWQAGWGNNETFLAYEGFVADPPTALGFYAGSGGGPSNCAFTDSMNDCLAGYAKPEYQKNLPGKYRQVPDISWLADPFAGVVIAVTLPNGHPSLQWQVWGGTSVACPMFSALWAIANQEAGAPLGQAAPYLYSLPAGAVYDILPVGSTTNVTATVRDSSGTTNYTAAEVGGVTSGKFISALWNDTDTEETGYVFTFGTDSGLRTALGWDNVTGVGTPNPKAFADSFRPTP